MVFLLEMRLQIILNSTETPWNPKCASCNEGTPVLLGNQPPKMVESWQVCHTYIIYIYKMFFSQHTSRLHVHMLHIYMLHIHIYIIDVYAIHACLQNHAQICQRITNKSGCCKERPSSKLVQKAHQL